MTENSVNAWRRFLTALNLSPRLNEDEESFFIEDFHVRSPGGLTVVLLRGTVLEVTSYPLPFVVVDGLPDSKAYPLYYLGERGEIANCLAVFGFSTSLREKKLFTNPTAIDLFTRKLHSQVLQRHGTDLLTALAAVKTTPKSTSAVSAEDLGVLAHLLAHVLALSATCPNNQFPFPLSESEVALLKRSLSQR